MISFSDLGLVEPLQKAVSDSGYTHPTPIQAQAIPHLLEGRDLLGCARTGTGKTAAFALPMLQRLSKPGHRLSHHTTARSVRALVVVPTRELAAQVADSFKTYGRGLHLSVAVVYGGVGQGPQVRALTRGVDILVATPGRLLDLMGQGHARLDRVEILVLDEADHMLDMGFIPDVRKILAAIPKGRQTLLFSATMPPPIARLADGILSNPAKVFVTPAATTVEEVEQRVHFVDRAGKIDLLAHLLAAPEVERSLVFTRTKRGADRVSRRLAQLGIGAEAIHGNKTQGARERTLEGFRGGRVRVLVATDIAARGIDVDDITHVFNFELPNVPEVYVHRIGRTARAGASGVAISLCDGEEREYLRDIERLIRRQVSVAENPDGVRTGHRRPERRHEHAGRGHVGTARADGHAERGHGHAARAGGHAERGQGYAARAGGHAEHGHARTARHFGRSAGGHHARPRKDDHPHVRSHHPARGHAAPARSSRSGRESPPASKAHSHRAPHSSREHSAARPSRAFGAGIGA